MLMVADPHSLLIIKWNMKEEEGMNSQLREPMYIDLTVEDDEIVDVEGRELTAKGSELELELESGESPWSQVTMSRWKLREES